MKAVFSGFCIAGSKRQRKPASSLRVWLSLLRLAVMGSGWRDGCAPTVSKPMHHAASVAVSREHRRAKTDRLDTEMLKRAFLGWLRGEPEHCQMAAIPTLAEEDARRPNRERDCLGASGRGSSTDEEALVRLGSGSIRNFARPLIGLTIWSARWARRCPQIRELSCGGIWRGLPCCVNKSRRSRQRVWNSWHRLPRKDRTPWFA